jgi:inner membrane protein
MDPVSQAALGAVVGQVAGHRTLGYRAAVVGALAGAAPDIDVLFSIGGDYFDQLVLHRGFTHSLFFAPLFAPLLGWLVWRLERARDPACRNDPRRLRAWVIVVGAALLSHPLLDVLTPYGTQLLHPFSDARFAINAMPIVDPVYTALLGIGLWLAAHRLRRHARAVAVATLMVSSGYLGFAWMLNAAAEQEARRQLTAAGIHDARVAAFPTLLQVHYRRVVARTPLEDRVGYVSMWAPCSIDWESRPGYTGPEVPQFLATREGRIFEWFTMGWIRYQPTMGGQGPVLRAVDLRYGFTEDPDHSLFHVFARIDPRDGRLGPVQLGDNDDAVVGERLAGLFQETYAPFCDVG